MKEVKAIIKPFRLENVIHALHEIDGLPGVTISTAHGLSAERGTFDQVVKTKLEIIVPDRLADSVVEAIQRAAHAGITGDGKICVLPVDEVVKIRTGQRGEDAI